VKINGSENGSIPNPSTWGHRYLNKSTYIDTGGQAFTGQIEDFRIYDRVLSAAEVEKLYNVQYIQKGLITDSTEEVVSFKYNSNNDNGSGQTEYTINFPQDTECDILVVAGGGGGSQAHGGGGGGGALIFMKEVVMNGNYIIKVGDGGDVEGTTGSAATGRGFKGNDSEIFKNNNNKIIAEGGGGGGLLDNAGTGGDGGSGGGGDGYNSSYAGGSGGSAIEYIPILHGTVGIKYGNNGGNSNPIGATGSGGGGGGAGSNGFTPSSNQSNTNHGGIGLATVNISGTNYDLKTYFKITDDIGEHHTDGKVYFAGGGGGGSWATSTGGTGGLGGGGNGGGGSSGSTDTTQQGENGTINSGGGGGGGGDWTPIGGKGGSGIVIIRYKTQIQTTVTRIDPKLSSLSSLTPEINSLLYFNTSNSINYLELDPTTLEITSDNKLKVIGGGGGGTQVLIQNESDTITSNLEKPIIDSSNLVTDGLIAHYKFDGNSYDSSGNNHLVIDTGTPTYDTNNEYIIANNDISFTISNPSNIITTGQTAMTISFWVNNWTTTGYLMRYRPSNIVIWYNGSSQLEFSAEGQTSQYNSFSDITSWTLLTMVYDGDNYNLYVNGTKEQTVSGSGNFDTGFTHDTSDNIWGIFENPSGTPSFKGHLKDLRFYNRALSAAEVEKLYNAQYIQKGQITDSTDEVVSFKYNPNNNNGSGQTEYTINFPEETECDILVVSGGGAGGKDAGGGGGGGGVAYTSSVIKMSGEYIIKVGNGGIFINDETHFAENGSTNGKNSLITNGTDIIETIGGGSGGFKTSSDKGNNGGSSGGGIYLNREPPGTVISAIKTGIFSNINTVGGQGNSGGSDYGGGGGGAGGAISSSTANGNDGIQINIDGNNYYWAGGGGGGFGGSNYTSALGGKGGGGGGGNFGNSASNPNGMKGGTGGINLGEDGEYGFSSSACKGGDGGEHTGGGGGGGANTTGGKGGSGIVIIRYKTQIVTTVTRIDPKLSSLSSLTPEVNSLLYFNTSNSINYLELDPTSLEITSDNKLKIIDNLLNKIENLESNLSILQNRIDVLENT
jgi:hypothetical protein